MAGDESDGMIGVAVRYGNSGIGQPADPRRDAGHDAERHAGAGGDRDRTKRPEMGRVVSTNSDLTIVTSDNPRSEGPDDIIDAVLVGAAPGAQVVREPDRRQAIVRALASAQSGDVVVIAGKGHESTRT